MLRYHNEVLVAVEYSSQSDSVLTLRRLGLFAGVDLTVDLHYVGPSVTLNHGKTALEDGWMMPRLKSTNNETGRSRRGFIETNGFVFYCSR